VKKNFDRRAQFKDSKFVNCQITKLSIFKTTYAKAVGLIVVVHVAAATVEVQKPAAGSAVLRTAPVVAAAASVSQDAIAVEEVAGGMEF
jgi:hypothetical protein